MSLTINAPLTGELFGPGFRVDTFTDAVGPQPPGTVWRITLFDTTTEDVIARISWTFTGNSGHFLMLNGDEADVRVVVGSAIALSGRSAFLQVELVQPGEVVIEDESVAVELDMLTGIPAQIQEYIRTHIPTSSAALTTEEHDSLVITQAAVTAGFGIDPLSLVAEVVQAIGSSNPLGYGSLQTPAQCVTGDGEFDDLDPLFPKWGLYWVATVIPAGLGHRHGQSEEYPSRLVQLRTVHEVGGVEMVTEIVNATTHGELWRFRFQRPLRVEYSVLPGVTVCASWWQFP